MLSVENVEFMDSLRESNSSYYYSKEESTSSETPLGMK